VRIELDLTTVPPGLALMDIENFKDLRVTARRVGDAFVSRQTLEELAGNRAADPEWSRQLDAMIAYADSKNWVRQDGAVQVHFAWE